MKSKKSFLSLGIIVLVLFLGVGYAVVSSVYLNIGGTASVNDQDLNVEITNAVASTNIAEKTVDFTHVLSNKNLTSNFTLNEMVLNEVVTITYTVTNNEIDVDAQLALASVVELSNSNSDYFDVDYEITDNETDLENNDKTMEVVVTVGLIKTPVTEENSSTTVGLTLTASPKGGNSGSGSGTEIEATEIYYNQPYNAVVSTETVASDTATYARNGQAYNVTNLYNNVSELQVNAKTLADKNNEVIKTLVVYDDLTVEIFMDGKLTASYPPSSVAIEGQTINVTDGFEAQISSDFRSITVGEEIYELNISASPLYVGGNHIYSGYTEDTPGQMMAMGVIFKDNTHLDVYFNGNLFGESSTEYYTIGNVIYIVNEGYEPSLYGYVSLDGTQIVSKGVCIYKYQGKEKVYYGRAYTGLGNFDGVDGIDRASYIVYRDGSVDFIVNWTLVQTLPAGSVTTNGDIFSFSDGSGSGVVKNDGHNLILINDGVETGTGFILENIRKSLSGTKYNFLTNGEIEDTLEFGNNTFSNSSSISGMYIISDKAILLEGFPYVLNYDESTGIYSTTIVDEDTPLEVKLVPVE